ncbi:uncharacterized protein LOC143031030 isoform X1 [Oratosquilla oratoria]|uniref:uncharacterized protein LOC143031030 isoform X1 n=1 Tax=Oratosquilla oratoria TaxID=337810 RepID=UPI003F7677D6
MYKIVKYKDSNEVHQTSQESYKEMVGFEIEEDNTILHDSDCHNNYDSSDYDYVSSDNDGNGDSQTFQIELMDLLSRWAVQFNVTHIALKELLKILSLVQPYLPKDPRTLIKIGKIDQIVQIQGGEYYHFGVATGILNQLTYRSDLLEQVVLKLHIIIDGLPLFKSAKTQFWPILGLIPGTAKSQPFAIGIFCGDSKPGSVEEFLSYFIDEMRELKVNGIKYEDKTYQVVIKAFVCDAPARSFIKCIKGHTGYTGCEKCDQSGVFEKKITFPDTNEQLRTDIAFDEMHDRDHHKGESPLKRLGVGLVSQVPLDYMHLVCLGVMKKLIWLWLKGPLTVRIGRQVKDSISERLQSLRQFIPREFSRKPRGLDDIDR